MLLTLPIFRCGKMAYLQNDNIMQKTTSRQYTEESLLLLIEFNIFLNDVIIPDAQYMCMYHVQTLDDSMCRDTRKIPRFPQEKTCC